MNKKVIWIVVGLFLAICAGESLIELRKALKDKEQRELSQPQQ